MRKSILVAKILISAAFISVFFQNCEGRFFTDESNGPVSHRVSEFSGATDTLVPVGKIAGDDTRFQNEVLNKISRMNHVDFVPSTIDRSNNQLKFKLDNDQALVFVFATKPGVFLQVNSGRDQLGASGSLQKSRLGSLEMNGFYENYDVKLHSFDSVSSGNQVDDRGVNSNSNPSEVSTYRFSQGWHTVSLPLGGVEQAYLIKVQDPKPDSGFPLEQSIGQSAQGGQGAQAGKNAVAEQMMQTPPERKPASNSTTTPVVSNQQNEDASSATNSTASNEASGKLTALDWFRKPFNRNSAHWRPIGTSARYSDDTDARTLSLRKHTFVVVNHHNVYGAAAAMASANSPNVTINWNNQLGGRGLPFTLRMDANQPFFDSNRGDRSYELLNPVTLIVDSFYGLDRSAKTASLHKQYDIRGLGHGTKPGERVGMSASGFSSLLGAVRAFELETRGMAIQHSHHIVFPRLAKHPGPMTLSKKIQWPAVGGDTGSSLPENNTGAIAYGELLAIPPISKGGPNFDKLSPPLSEPGRRLFEAFRNYGLYAIDGGDHAILRADGPINAEVLNQVKSDFKNHLFKYLRAVTNSVDGANAEVITGTKYSQRGSLGTPSYPAGGGQPLAPNVGYPQP